MAKQFIPFKGWYPGYKGAKPVGAGGPVYITQEEYSALKAPVAPAPVVPAPVSTPKPTLTPTPTPTGTPEALAAFNQSMVQQVPTDLAAFNQSMVSPSAPWNLSDWEIGRGETP